MMALWGERPCHSLGPCELCGGGHEEPHRLAHAARELPGGTRISREAVGEAWRAVGVTDEARATGTLVRYWWRRARRIPAEL